MRDPRDLYTFESADLAAAVPRGRLPLVHALPGIVDAGGACRIATTYLFDSLRHVRLVGFDIDELIDYRGSRPQAEFDGATFAEIEMPRLDLHLMYDEVDRPFLLLSGPEPDLQWQRLAQAIIDLVEYFDVDEVVSMNAVPMAVPHTRPIGLITHVNMCALENGDHEVAPGDGRITVPAAFGALLEKELDRAGHAAYGYVAQVPHYLTRSDFPAGALALLRRVSRSTGLEIPLVDLGDLSSAASAALVHTLEDNEEVQSVVHALEDSYDRLADDTGTGGLATTMDMPTAAELGDRFERFLAHRDDDGPLGS